MASKPIVLLTAAFGSETGESAGVEMRGKFNLSISGTFTATVQLQRSFDGAAWHQVGSNYTAPAQAVLEEPEAGVLYRVACTAYTDGEAVCRLSR